MTTEKLIIEKLRQLNPEQQQQIWELINILSKSETSENLASANFERHFGALSLENVTPIDNESIDADLANEYANVHEVE